MKDMFWESRHVRHLLRSHSCSWPQTKWVEVFESVCCSGASTFVSIQIGDCDHRGFGFSKENQVHSRSVFSVEFAKVVIFTNILLLPWRLEAMMHTQSKEWRSGTGPLTVFFSPQQTHGVTWYSQPICASITQLFLTVLAHYRQSIKDPLRIDYFSPREVI